MGLTRRLRFGDFEIDVFPGRLSRAGQTVRIQPQPLRVLTTLAERAPAVVTREELKDSVWDRTTFVEFDQGLNFCIRQIRVALADNVAAPIYLETIKRHGYRFIAPVTADASPDDAPRDPAAGAHALAAGAERWSWPLILDRLIGREHELVHLEALLASEPLVTLTGPGGVGKTRLAIECARRFAAARGRVQWIDLTEAPQPADVVPTFARALGIPDTAPTALAARLRDVLAARPALFIVDNFEHVLPAAPVLLDFAGLDARARFLVTSRVRLNLRGEHEFAVPPLRARRDQTEQREGRRSPAVELYVDRLGATVDPSIDDDAERLCARLDGLPLAIELAAARARVLPTSDLVRRERLITLLTDAPRDAPDRHQTLVRTLEWSFGLLPVEAQRGLSTLAVFVGGFTVAAAVDVLMETEIAASEIAALDVISTLRDHSLIARAPSNAGHERWHLLETVREFALERRSVGEIAGAERARAQYLAVWIQQEAPALRTDADTWTMPALLDEHANLLAALQWALTSSPQTLVSLVNAATWFWHTANLFSEGREWATAAFRRTAAERDIDPLSRRRLLAADALQTYHVGPFEAAMAPVERLIADGIHDFEGTLACGLKAALLAFSGDLGAADSAAQIARTAAASLRDPWLEGFAAYGSALSAALAGHHAVAEQYLAEAPTGLGFLSVLLDLNRRLQQIEQGKFADAASGFANCLRQRYGGYRPIRQIAAAVEGIGYVAGHAGDWHTCARLLARADRWRLETAPLHPTWRRQHAWAIEGARENLGARFDRVSEDGASLTLEDAVALAAQTADTAAAISSRRDPGRRPPAE